MLSHPTWMCRQCTRSTGGSGHHRAGKLRDGPSGNCNLYMLRCSLQQRNRLLMADVLVEWLPIYRQDLISFLQLPIADKQSRQIICSASVHAQPSSSWHKCTIILHLTAKIWSCAISGSSRFAGVREITWDKTELGTVKQFIAGFYSSNLLLGFFRAGIYCRPPSVHQHSGQTEWAEKHACPRLDTPP